MLGGGTLVPVDGNLIYDPETDSWSTGDAMPTARDRLAVAVVDDVLYAIGGQKGFVQTYYRANERYTPSGYIPEFPSWVFLLLLLVLVTVVSAVYARKTYL